MLTSELDFASFWAKNYHDNSTELVRKEITISAYIFVTFTYSITEITIIYSDWYLAGKKNYIWIQILLLYEISEKAQIFVGLNYSSALSDEIFQGWRKFGPMKV